jgi:hypothetical protein
MSSKLDQSCLVRVEFQAKLGHPFPQGVQTESSFYFAAKTYYKSSSPGELHPQALTEPDGNLSAHPALIVQSQVESHVTIARTSPVPCEQHGPTSGRLAVDGSETF